MNHNLSLINEYKRGEEGIDYSVRQGKVGDPRIANVSKFTKDARAEINALKMEDPALGKFYDDLLLKRSQFD